MFSKKYYKFFLAMLALFVIIASMGMAQAAPAGSSPVGVVDFVYLINQHPDTPKAHETLRAEQEAARKEFVDKSAGLSDGEKQNLELQLGQRLGQKRQELLKPIADSVYAAMKVVADARGLTVVVYKNTVALGGTDITDEVLKKITGK